MKPIFPMPDVQKLYLFIHHSNAIEHETTSIADIDQTFKRTAIWPNPLAGGHIEAVGYALDLASKEEFPAKHPIQFSTVAQSTINLYWLRDLQKKIMLPIAEHAKSMYDKNAIRVQDCGPYRLHPRRIGMNRMMPPPHLIEKLLQRWYSDIGQFHLSVVGKVHRPSREILLAVDAMALKAHIQLQCIHPWVDGTGRSARLLENILRLRWGLPWKNPDQNEAQKYVREISTYEDGPEWQSILKSVA
jgi:Fic family protein